MNTPITMVGMPESMLSTSRTAFAATRAGELGREDRRQDADRHGDQRRDPTMINVPTIELAIPPTSEELVSKTLDNGVSVKNDQLTPARRA